MALWWHVWSPRCEKISVRVTQEMVGTLPSAAAAAAAVPWMHPRALDAPEDLDSEEPSHNPRNWHTERGRVELGNWASQDVLGAPLSVKKPRRSALVAEHNQQNIQVQMGYSAPCLIPSDYLSLKKSFKRANLCHTRLLTHFMWGKYWFQDTTSTFLCVFYIKNNSIFSLHTVAFNSLKQNYMDSHLHDKISKKFWYKTKVDGLRFGSAFS